MKKEGLFLSYLFFIFLYITFAVHALLQKSIWAFDGTLYAVVLTILYCFSKNLDLNKYEFALLNLGMLLQLAGYLGAFGWNIPFFHYDKIVHFFSSAVVAYVLFKFVSKLLAEKTIRSNVALFLFLLVSASIALGLIVEFIEFGGFYLVGNQDNILSPGVGYKPVDIYQDTMGDIFSNSIGSFFGASLYLFWPRKKTHLVYK